MRLFAVIAERLAVVARDDDERRLIRGANLVEERRERGIGRGHFTVVGPSRVLRIEWRRRAIRRMGIEDVQPEEPWWAGWARWAGWGSRETPTRPTRPIPP